MACLLSLKSHIEIALTRESVGRTAVLSQRQECWVLLRKYME